MDQVVAWLEGSQIAWPTVLATLALLAGAALAIVLVNRLMKNWLRRVEARLGLRSEETITVVRVANTVLWFVVLLLAFDLWGVGLSGLWAVLASAATIIGVGFLATWAMVSNITANLFLTMWRPFRLGDTVELLPEKLKGRAVDRNLMFTVLREDDGCVLQVPNNLFFQKIFRVGGG
jgi:small-conductance mechanosensitive channel